MAIDPELMRQVDQEFEEELDEYMKEWTKSLEEHVKQLETNGTAL